jgi:hypothetical protein
MKNRKHIQFLTIALFICLGFHLNAQEICNNGIDNDGFLDCIDNDCNNFQVCTMMHSNTSFRSNYFKRPPQEFYWVSMFNEHIKELIFKIDSICLS